MPASKTATLGFGETTVTIGRIGHGLMNMSIRDPSDILPDETAFAAIKAGIGALPEGAQMHLNTGEFYGNGFGIANLELVARFFAKYPEYAPRSFLSVKGGMLPNSVKADGSPENLRRSATTTLAPGGKKMDLFQMARVPTNVSFEEAFGTLVALKTEGYFTHIGMSECSAGTLRKAHAIHPVSVVEIEVSAWSYEDETKKVIAAAQELGIVLVCPIRVSPHPVPLGRGLLSGTIKSLDDIPAGDYRRKLTRFQEEAFAHNAEIAEAFGAVAVRKGVTASQLALAWVLCLGPHMVPIHGTSSATRHLGNIAAADVELTGEDLAEIRKVLEKGVKGSRIMDGVPAEKLRLWA
ncbi:aldo/keto reductase [Epithele typhae]|uniref:aldo/keto reductase n=1 Tax=Epithele typhae TaxID=378194 RepID=UPI00200763AC|nr:aldo/keto reductase [Epithele typhae]KAH9929058.1 aldo/keto reductase [Epithele typhae]